MLPALKNHIKWFFQRRKRGFDDRETYSLDMITAQFLVPRLKALKQKRLEIMEEDPQWSAIVEKMIYSFEALSDFERAEEQFVIEEGEYKTKLMDDDDDTFTIERTKKPVIDKKALRKHRKKVKRGLRLFTRHFHTLWW